MSVVKHKVPCSACVCYAQHVGQVFIILITAITIHVIIVHIINNMMTDRLGLSNQYGSRHPPPTQHPPPRHHRAHHQQHDDRPTWPQPSIRLQAPASDSTPASVSRRSAEGAPSMATSAGGVSARRCTRRGANARTEICTVRSKHEICGDERGRLTRT